MSTMIKTSLFVYCSNNLEENQLDHTGPRKNIPAEDKGLYKYYVVLFTVNVLGETMFLVSQVEHLKLNQTTAAL